MKKNCIFILTALAVNLSVGAQEKCNAVVIATKAFPMAANTVTWQSNRPAEYIFPGEKVHIKVKGELNLKPEKKSKDRGGVFGFFKSRTEWVEAHPMKPAQKKPSFPNVKMVAGSEKLNEDGSYECDVLVERGGEGLSRKVLLEVAVLTEDELSGSGGPTTGQYDITLSIDNTQRLALVQAEINARLTEWSGQAVKELKNIIEADERLKCNYFDELAMTIMKKCLSLPAAVKQQILQYANGLAPGNHEVTIELASTYSGQPFGCEKQKALLKSQGINSVQVNANDFKTIDNSARTFDLLASAYFECSEDFRDATSVDSVRNYYRIAATQYGMVYNYPKQIEMAIAYANLELDNNNKQAITQAAQFLQETREHIPASIDSVGEEERNAFFGKFGNTRYKFVRDVQKSVEVTLKQRNNPKSDLFADHVNFILKKKDDGEWQLNYHYADSYLYTLPNETTQHLHTTNWKIQCRLDNNQKVGSFEMISNQLPPSNVLLTSERAIMQSEAEIRNKLPGAVLALIAYLDVPQYCPSAEINGNHVMHDLQSFQLLYFKGENTYTAKMNNSLFFSVLKNSFGLLSGKKIALKESADQLILNMAAAPSIVDGFGIIWDITSVKFQ